MITTASPFDGVRDTRADGTDFWSARDLQQLLGYERWERFETAVERAIAACENSGHEPKDHFRGAAKKVSLGSGATRAVIDWHLSRYAAYLVAMNGDPRKDEIAAAQTYFAVKTREAEITAMKTASPAMPTFAQALRGWADEVEAREAAEARVAELAPRAEIADRYEENPGPTLTQLHKAYFPTVRARDFFEHLYQRRYLIDQRGTRWSETRQEWRDGHEHGHPTAKGKRFFYLASRLDPNGVRRYQARVIPGDAEHQLVAALHRDGLTPRVPSGPAELT
ncbi:BRO family protein [Streptomyces sp. NPDC088768]|uniref:BRO family protein n=1 Tax=Streptomyces sp. NPDC088768 TaxID=3365894 RepID=UPI00381686C4